MILSDIKNLLEKEEFDCTLVPATEKAPSSRLLVFLGIDDKKRERILEISAGQLETSEEFNLPHVNTLPHRLQFRVLLPFQVQDLALNQVASLLLFLNQFIDLPGFELNELEGQVFYRYVWLMQPSIMNSRLLMSLIGAIILNLGLFSETIESLADGKISFNDLLSEIVKSPFNHSRS